MSESEKPKKGFARLTPEERRAVSSKGGKAVHAAGTAHEWTKEEARIAGRKGGLRSLGKEVNNPESYVDDEPSGGPP